MSAFLSSVPKLQFFDANGDPLVGGKLYTYAAGTTTPLATYTDSTGATPNTNPIILDSRGEANVWLTAVAYKFELKTSADALIWTVDNISNALNLSQLLANSGSAANPPYTFAADPTTGMYLGAVGQIALSANGTPVLRSSDTSMTIGQAGGSNDVDTTVYGDFSVNGLLEVTSSSDPSQAFYRPTNSPGAGVGRVTWEGQNSSNARASYARIQGEITANTAGAHTGNLNFYTATAGALTEKMRIDTAGNVGVGTGSPSGASGKVLEVNGGAGQARLVLKNDTTGSASTDGSQIALVNSQLVIQNRESAEIIFETSGAEQMRIDASGNVGIGNTPSVKLDVQGAGTIRGFLSTTDAIKLGANTSAPTTTDAFIYRPANNTLAFGTASTEQVRITSAGLLQFNSGYGSVATAYGCRAWINFNGTGTPAARASGNVSSITDNAAGDYTLNFTTAFPDANYAPVFGYGQEDTAAGYKFAVRIGTAQTGSPTTMTTTALRIISGVPSPTDFANLYVAIFR
jgi:hypothetical protein